jgi:PilZ domain
LPSFQGATKLKHPVEMQTAERLKHSPMSETLKTAESTTAGSEAGRRSHVRYKFVASADLVAAGLGKRIEGRVSDLSQQGCYVDAHTGFPMGTIVTIGITREAKRFEAQAQVVFNQDGKGMGLLFAAIAPAQVPVLEAWLSASRETSWLAANRRRSQRIVIKVPVRVDSPRGVAPPFNEESSTLTISAHGASIWLSERVRKGQRLILSNAKTGSSAECIVAHIGESEESRVQIGMAFVLPSAAFWHVHFPPADWTSRHEDAKQVTVGPAKG